MSKFTSSSKMAKSFAEDYPAAALGALVLVLIVWMVVYKQTCNCKRIGRLERALGIEGMSVFDKGVVKFNPDQTEGMNVFDKGIVKYNPDQEGMSDRGSQIALAQAEMIN